MGHGSGKLDMTHSFSSDLLLSNLDAALFADLAFVTDSLILSAEALPVLCRAEDSLTEEAVSFCLEGAVVDRFLGFFTTPCDQLLIISGDARPIFIESKTLRSINSVPSLEIFDFL